MLEHSIDHSGTDAFFVPVEFKFLSESGTTAGEFSGYGSVFGVEDSHGDVVAPGAFAKSLAQHKARGTMPGLYVEHSQHNPFGGDPLPVGRWLDIQEDSRGLKVHGKLSALETEHGRRVRALMQDGALSGLSIAYSVPPWGAKLGKDKSEPKRTLREIDLHDIDIVAKPSNRQARVEAVKSGLLRFETKRQLEDHLRESGLGAGLTRLIAQAAWPALEGQSENPDAMEALALRVEAARLSLKQFL